METRTMLYEYRNIRTADKARMECLLACLLGDRKAAVEPGKGSTSASRRTAAVVTLHTATSSCELRYFRPGGCPLDGIRLAVAVRCGVLERAHGAGRDNLLRLGLN